MIEHDAMGRKFHLAYTVPGDVLLNPTSLVDDSIVLGCVHLFHAAMREAGHRLTAENWTQVWLETSGDFFKDNDTIIHVWSLVE